MMHIYTHNTQIKATVQTQYLSNRRLRALDVQTSVGFTLLITGTMLFACAHRLHAPSATDSNSSISHVSSSSAVRKYESGSNVRNDTFASSPRAPPCY
jgi:hypothetical protein